MKIDKAIEVFNEHPDIIAEVVPYIAQESVPRKLVPVFFSRTCHKKDPARMSHYLVSLEGYISEKKYFGRLQPNWLEYSDWHCIGLTWLAV